MFQKKVITSSDWLFGILLLPIPIIGQFLLFRWAIHSKINPTFQSFMRMILLITIVGYLIMILIEKYLEIEHKEPRQLDNIFESESIATISWLRAILLLLIPIYDVYLLIYWSMKPTINKTFQEFMRLVITIPLFAWLSYEFVMRFVKPMGYQPF